MENKQEGSEEKTSYRNGLCDPGTRSPPHCITLFFLRHLPLEKAPVETSYLVSGACLHLPSLQREARTLPLPSADPPPTAFSPGELYLPSSSESRIQPQSLQDPLNTLKTC